MTPPLGGIHHVTAITAGVQRNVDFYVGALGLRLVKQTVNFDRPDTYHLYFGDRVGSPGTAMTFFGWPRVPPRPPGPGQVTAVAFAVPEASLGHWDDRLRRLGLDPRREERLGVAVLAFRDPDGIALEVAGAASDAGWTAWPEGPVPPEHAIRGFHSVALTVAAEEPTAALLTGVLGFRPAGRETGRARYALGSGGPGAALDLVPAPGAAPGEEGTGTVHHVAWRVADDAAQAGWREALVAAGQEVTPVRDRKYFRSIYFREPGGVLFELATDGPGFTVDEPVEALGSGLQLPPWEEGSRPRLEHNLPAIVSRHFT